MPGDLQIPAQFDAITNQIVISNVSASAGGFIVLDGEIISTNAFGEINVNSGAGQVNINNQTNYPIVVNNVAASASKTSSSLSGVDIIDRNPDVNHANACMFTSRTMSSTCTSARSARPSSNWSRARRP